ncbi:MAG: AMP-binding protein [Deltaproteobacteria bacterium]|nr:MAG: AMP-binding protein [Deltaproteobacteria bacterium]
MKSNNLARDFFKSVEKYRHRACFKYKKENEWKSLSWLEVGEKVKEVALGLSVLGVKKGDAVALFANTCMEWTVADLAILSLGAVSVPIYQSNTPDQVAYILNDSGARWSFVENNHLLKKIKAELSNLPSLQKVILFHGKKESHEMQMTLEELQKVGTAEGNEADWKEGLENIDPSQTATLVYTSGTTGPPKGAILTHGNFLAGIDACTSLFTISENDTSILFLPLAHILAREMQFYHLRVGFTQAFAESIDKLVDNLAEVKPHFFVAVPRIFEKVYEKILQQVEAGSPTKKAIFKWGVEVGNEVSRRAQKKTIPILDFMVTK